MPVAEQVTGARGAGRSLRVLEIDRWPPLALPEAVAGGAALRRVESPPGYYPMEGVAGYWFWHNARALPVTTLAIDGRVVMVDDPMHWLGMLRLAQAASGRVAVGGLGLGLLVHHLVTNSAVTRIDVTEIREDVARLVAPLLPADARIRVHVGDFLAPGAVTSHHDTVIADLWVNSADGGLHRAGAGRAEPAALRAALEALRGRAPRGRLFCFGLRSRRLNPAVTVDLPPLYWQLVGGRAGRAASGQSV